MVLGKKPQKKVNLSLYHYDLFLKKIIEKIATSLYNVNFFSNKHILTQSFADSQHKQDIELVLGKKPQKKVNLSVYHYDLFLKKIIEKIATSLYKVNFFSNKHILTKSFADSQFTEPIPIQLALNQKYRKMAIFHNTNKTYFKSDYREK